MVKLSKRLDTHHCCYCGRDAFMLLHHSTREGTPYRTKKNKPSQAPTALLYVTARNEAICPRCYSEHMVALNNGGKPILAYDRGTGRYLTAPRILANISQEHVDFGEDTQYFIR